MVDIPSREPAEFVVGTTVAWTRSDLGSFPASQGWTLRYDLANRAQHIAINASASGDAFAVSILAADTAKMAPGRYAWNAFVTKGSETYSAGSGVITLKPNLTTAVDVRSHARKTLEAIEAVIEGRANLDQMAFQIAGRSLDRTPLPDLVAFAEHYRGLVKGEDAAADLQAGRPGRRKVLTRFRGPTAP